MWPLWPLVQAHEVITSLPLAAYCPEALSTRNGEYWAQSIVPLGSKVPNYRVFRGSILRIVIMVLGKYLIVGYLDP